MTSSLSEIPSLTRRQSGVLLFSILIVALCGIVYELIIGTVSSYLLGNSVYQFSLTIGFFMFAMGIGSLISKYFDESYVRNFILVEIAIALVGGVCSVALFLAFPFARVLYETIQYSLILLIGALVGMEIPILTTLLTKNKKLKESIAEVMSLDYVGALIGSVSFPLLLLPSLGLIQSSFAIGIINILIAIANVVVFRNHLAHFHTMLRACIVVLALLVLCVFGGSEISHFAEKHLYFDQVIFSKQTPYQKIVVTRSTTTRDQRLFIDGHIQFSSRDEYRYHEYLVHPLLAQPGSRENILILGGGDGLAAREVLKYSDVKLLHLVDIDPEMVRIGRDLPTLERLNHKSLHDPRVSIFNEDAFSFINQPGILYDRVIIDMPDPHNEAINKLYSREFYKMIAHRLAENGILVTQSSSPFFTRRVFWCIEATLASVFDFTRSYHTALPSFGIWGFNMARNGSEFSDEVQLTVATRAITNKGMLLASTFDKDMTRLEMPVNSIMEPKLYQFYIEDLRR